MAIKKKPAEAAALAKQETNGQPKHLMGDHKLSGETNNNNTLTATAGSGGTAGEAPSTAAVVVEAGQLAGNVNKGETRAEQQDEHQHYHHPPPKNQQLNQHQQQQPQPQKQQQQKVNPQHVIEVPAKAGADDDEDDGGDNHKKMEAADATQNQVAANELARHPPREGATTSTATAKSTSTATATSTSTEERTSNEVGENCGGDNDNDDNKKNLRNNNEAHNEVNFSEQQQQQEEATKITSNHNNNNNNSNNHSNSSNNHLLENNNNNNNTAKKQTPSAGGQKLLTTTPPTTTGKTLNEEISLITNHLEQQSHEQDLQYYKQQQQQARPRQPRRLGFFQSLLLRKWPYLAVTICIMSSLLFGILLSAMTVYLMHDWTDCGALAVSSSSAASVSAAASPNPLIGNNHNHQQMLPHDRLDFPAADTPIELSSGGVPALAALDGELSARSASGAASSAAGELEAGTSSASRFQRLPTHVMPDHYDLFIWPRIAEPFNFTGQVRIRIKCREPTDNISLHALDLDLNEKTISLEWLGPSTAPPGEQPASISRHRRQLQQQSAPPPADKQPATANKTTTTTTTTAAPAQAPKVKRLSQDKQLQYSIIHLDAPLRPGQDYLLSVDFTGLLNDDLAGFYKIKYDRQNSSEPTWIAATQFQATDARRSFPCFDEPLFKATFSIKIKHWKNMTALSNMPIINQEESADGLWLTDTFAKSHRMSTYLVAFAVTNFESRSEGNISVWTRPGFIHTADYALRIAGKILRHYEDFFGIEYPLPKMDMIALPDFNAGAMENWGLVTYRETAMLFDEQNSSVGNKQRVATVVAHELAHQWFGNLVTPKWWDDLWLNEGFASFVEYIGVDHVEPKARMLDQFVVLEIQNVLKFDGLSSSHQISIPVNNPEEITEIFDHISYSKGASVIRMMSHFLTEPVFKLGLKRYLRALKYDNAEQSDLWAHLSEAQRMVAANASSSSSSSSRGQIDLGQVMNSWTLQIGYPLVTLTRSYDGSHRAKLEQVRYEPYNTILPPSAALSNNKSTSANTTTTKQRWEIPITYTWKSDQNWTPTTRLWLHQNESTTTSGGVDISPSELPKSDNEWVIVNVNQVGYYRVNYDQRNWKLLVDQLEEDYSQISPANRAQILDDIFELAKAGILDYKFAMGATRYLRNERNYLPWETALTSFSYINDMLQRTPIYGDWKDYTSDLIEPYYARYRDLEWTQSSANKGGLLKQQLLSPSSNNNNKTTTATAFNQQQPTKMVAPIDSEDITEHYNQVNAIASACTVHSHCIEKAKALFKQWKQSNQNNINPALRSTIYCTAIENGNKDDWNFLWRVYEREQNPNERDRILKALSCSKEIWILSRYLEWTFDKTKPIRRQDGSYVFRAIANNNYGREVAFNFIRERWSTIKEYYGKSSFAFGSLVRSIATSLNTQVELDQLHTFYESIKGDVGTAKRSFQIAIEEVEFNIRWRNRNYKNLEDWLQQERSNFNNSNRTTTLVH